MQRFLSLLITFVVLASVELEAGGPESLAKRIAEEIAVARLIAADPVVVAAVRGYNIAPGREAQSMTESKWRVLTPLDPLVRTYTRCAAAQVIRQRKSADMSEAFLSGLDGGKIAFLSKPSRWSHAGMDKHEMPLRGKSWQGEPEFDESTGKTQIQFSIPVLDGDHAIGSLVIGLLVVPHRS